MTDFGRRSAHGTKDTSDGRSLPPETQWTGDPVRTPTQPLLDAVQRGDLVLTSAPSQPISNAAHRLRQWIKRGLQL